MTKLEITRHAGRRMRQRSISMSDIDLILQNGEEIEGQGVLMSNKAADSLIRSLKSQITAIDRLRNRKIVLAGATLVTCYPCGNREK
jgi:Domain of unknown function (DUF4258)